MSEGTAALAAVNGQRFGRLVALGFACLEKGIGKPNFRTWHFRCDCGETLTAPLFKAKRGWLTSCGCADREEADRLFAIPGNARARVRAIALRSDVAVLRYERVIVSTAKNVVTQWVDERVFSAEQIFVIEEAKMLWALIARPSHDFFDTDDPEDRREGLLAERAKCLLRNCRRLVGSTRWSIFENVVRWNEPLGFIGSRMMEVEKTSGGHAKAIVVDVADRIANAGLLDETGFSRLVGE